MRIAYFDLETTGLDEDSHNTCGVIAYSGGDTEWYHSGYGRPMSASIGRQMLDALSAADRVVSFNGAQFDFKCLWRLTRARKITGCFRSSLLLRVRVSTRQMIAMQRWASPGTLVRSGMFSIAGAIQGT